jgi:phosphonatase-like hydrolase
MSLKLFVFDIAGTTIVDNDELLACFIDTCERVGITASKQRLNALMGVSKLEVFFQLWKEQLGPETTSVEIKKKADDSYELFKVIIEQYYANATLLPTKGALDIFSWARSRGLKIALNTGFYRKVAEIILLKIGWLPLGPTSPIDYLICSDEVPAGRPKPFMIQNIMNHFGIEDPQCIIKVGDTPVDLMEGRNANCLLSLGVTNGTHRLEELRLYDNDGLLPSLSELPAFLVDKGVFTTI